MRLMNRFFLLIGFCLLSQESLYAGDWVVHASDLKEKHAGITQLEMQIEDLIDQKNKTQDAAAVKSLLEQIVSSHEDLTKKVEEYNELRNHIRFEHPAQGDDTERLYHLKKLKALDEFEGATGMRGKLERLKRDMITVYGIEEKSKLPPKPVEKKEEDLNTETPRIKLSY